MPHTGEAMSWIENPRGANVHWTQHEIAPAGVAGVEYGLVADLFGDGRAVVVMGDSSRLVVGWYVPGSDPTQPWIAHSISPTGFAGAAQVHHGMGVGDLNGDGRLDVLTPVAWSSKRAIRTSGYSTRSRRRSGQRRTPPCRRRTPRRPAAACGHTTSTATASPTWCARARTISASTGSGRSARAARPTQPSSSTRLTRRPCPRCTRSTLPT